MLLSKNPPTEEKPDVIDGFNPYFSGCFSLSQMDGIDVLASYVVSILIFLDASL